MSGMTNSVKKEAYLSNFEKQCLTTHWNVKDKKVHTVV